MAPTATGPDPESPLILTNTTATYAEVRDAATGTLLATITCGEDGVLNISGNAIASFVMYDFAPERNADIFLHAAMPAPPTMQVLHQVITEKR